jgi:hypothetical protein
MKLWVSVAFRIETCAACEAEGSGHLTITATITSRRGSKIVAWRRFGGIIFRDVLLWCARH